MATWCCTLCCRCLVLAKLFFIQHVLDETHARSIIPKSAGSTFAFEVNVINAFFVVQCQSDVVMVPRPHLKELPSVAKHDQRPLNMIRNLHNQNFVVGIKKTFQHFYAVFPSTEIDNWFDWHHWRPLQNRIHLITGQVGERTHDRTGSNFASWGSPPPLFEWMGTALGNLFKRDKM